MDIDIDLGATFISILIGFILGCIVMYVFRRKPEPKPDGVLELIDHEDSLLVGVDIQTPPEELREKEVAVFKINKVA